MLVVADCIRIQLTKIPSGCFRTVLSSWFVLFVGKLKTEIPNVSVRR